MVLGPKTRFESVVFQCSLCHLAASSWISFLIKYSEPCSGPKQYKTHHICTVTEPVRKWSVGKGSYSLSQSFYWGSTDLERGQTLAPPPSKKKMPGGSILVIVEKICYENLYFDNFRHKKISKVNKMYIVPCSP